MSRQPDDRDPGEGTAVPRAARGARRIRHRQCRDGGSARMMAGLGFAALATSSGASAGLLRRGARNCSGNDQARGRGGTRRLLDRGCERQSGRTDLRAQPCDGAYRCRRCSSAGIAVPVHADRADGKFLRGRPDLDDTIKRLKAYEAAGADTLMAPGLPNLEAVRAVCAAVKKPFNFMVGIKGKSTARGCTVACRRPRRRGSRQAGSAAARY